MRVFRTDHRYGWLVTGTALLNILQWALLALSIRDVQKSEPIPLHYTITFGIDRIGPWYAIFLLPFSGTAIFLLTLLLSLMTIEHQRVTTMFILIIMLFMELILLASASLIARVILAP